MSLNRMSEVRNFRGARSQDGTMSEGLRDPKFDSKSETRATTQGNHCKIREK